VACDLLIQLLSSRDFTPKSAEEKSVTLSPINPRFSRSFSPVLPADCHLFFR
jgi:hypothetical protein